MAAFPTTPGGVPSAADTPLLPPACSQCLIAMLSLALLTAIFMVTCLVLSFKVAHLSQRSPPRRITPTAPTDVELWASPPMSQSLSTLLMTEEPAPNPPPSFSPDWDEMMARQPRVTMQDLGEFWWRSNATAV